MVDVKEGGAVNAASTMTKAANLTSKVRRRMYSRAVKDLQHVKKRSLETVDKLNFTVDLVSNYIIMLFLTNLRLMPLFIL